MSDARSYASSVEPISGTVQDDAPPVDPEAVREAYRRQRAVRRARVEQQRRAKRAGARFWVVFVLLVAALVLLVLTTWQAVSRLFGL